MISIDRFRKSSILVLVAYIVIAVLSIMLVKPSVRSEEDVVADTVYMIAASYSFICVSQLIAILITCSAKLRDQLR